MVPIQILKTVGRNWRALLDVVTSVALLGAIAVLILPHLRGEPTSAGPSASELPVPSEPLQVNGASAIGSPDAAYALIEFSDFECPFCGRFARETLPALRREFVDKGKLLFVFRHLPLSIHPLARGAAIAAACAGRQGKFWMLHETLFQPAVALEPVSIKSAVAGMGADVGQFENCLVTEGPNEVSADVNTAAQLGIKGTPAFFLGVLQKDRTVRVLATLSGARPIEDFERFLRQSIK
jgi:protein-disulfide isomerase